MRKIEFNAWIPDLGYMLTDVSVGHGTIGFGSDDADFEEALKAKGFDSENYNVPDWLYDTGEDWYIITESKAFILLQLTGFRDKSNDQIFEFDFVKTQHKIYDGGCLTISKIAFVDGCWKLVHEGKADVPLFLFKPDEIQIIGNIYQNHELC